MAELRENAKSSPVRSRNVADISGGLLRGSPSLVAVAHWVPIALTASS